MQCEGVQTSDSVALILVQAAPVLEAGAQSRAVYLPGAGLWYDAQTGALVKPDKAGALSVPVTMDDVPSYLRGGHIIPLRVSPGVIPLHPTVSDLPPHSWHQAACILL